MENGLLKNLLKRIKLNESRISMILGALVVVVIGAIIVNYFRGINREEVSQVKPQVESEEVKLIEEEGKLVPENLPKTHQVAVGENLWKIAEKFYSSGYNWVDIAKENNLTNPDKLAIGQELNIPKTPVIQLEIKDQNVTAPSLATAENYTVKKGDHLWGIALKTYGDGYKWAEIAQTNHLENPNLIYPGNTLTLPR